MTKKREFDRRFSKDRMEAFHESYLSLKIDIEGVVHRSKAIPILIKEVDRLNYLIMQIEDWEILTGLPWFPNADQGIPFAGKDTEDSEQEKKKQYEKLISTSGPYPIKFLTSDGEIPKPEGR
jgi:hypothetical protein